MAGAWWVRERTTSQAVAPAATAKAATTRRSQPHPGPSTRPRVREATATISRPTPSRSGTRAWSGSRTSASTRGVRTAATMAMGTLTRKIRCQLASTSRPPMGGPAAAPTAPIEAQAPITRARRSGATMGSSRPSDVGVTAAAPTACRTRAATRASTVGATAQSSEPRANTQEAAGEHAAAADEVAELAGGDQQGGEDDRVGVEDPGQAGDARAIEVGPDRWERDVDDEQVEHGEEDAGGDDGEGQAEGPRVGGGRGGHRKLPSSCITQRTVGESVA